MCAILQVTMRVASHFHHQIDEIPHVWIPLSDGTRLSAKIWLPNDAAAKPVPAILEYLPYRKDDASASLDETHHRYFAGNGYAALRVDIRGTGDSEGVITGEYSPQEQRDAEDVLAWIAKQKWCTGKVGMYGYSWGGFNGLQIASRRPPQLKAVISVCSTDDRYRNDCHYMGGCLLASDMLKWASIMLAYNACPPDPQRVGSRWRKMWLERLKQTPPFIEQWLTHQHRDDFWKQGSVREDYAAIECPVFLVGGWSDPYVEAIPRMLEGLTAPRRALIGPWAHAFPEWGIPGPSIDFLAECLRWWDRWLKGKDTRIMDEPLLRYWQMQSATPASSHERWPGSWMAENEWPAASVAPSRFWFAANGEMRRSAPAATRIEFSGDQCTGSDGGVWCPNGGDGDFPADQRRDNAKSVVWTSAPLKRPLALLGSPKITLRVASDEPLALVAVRLCDIAPGGAATRVAWGMLNLAHRESDERPEPLEPGKFYDVSLQLGAVGYELQPGHRWQIDLSPTYWPHAWPSPRSATLTFALGSHSFVDLPVREGGHAYRSRFGEAVIAMPRILELLRRGGRHREIMHDAATSACTIVDDVDEGCYRYPDGTEWERHAKDEYAILDNEPLSAASRCERTFMVRRGKWHTRIETQSALTCDAANFFVTNILRAYEGKKIIFEKKWEKAIRRELL